MAAVVKNYLAKPTAIVHSSNEMSVTERKILNVLLRRARTNILSQQTHTITVNELIEQLGLGRYSNQQFLKESLLGLVNNSIRLNLIGKDKRVKIESAISVLSRVDIVEGRVMYSFSKEIIKIMSKPTIYAYINLDLQKLMNSKHSVAMWEFCSEQLDSVKRTEMETSPLTIENVRELLGAHGSAYDDFRYLKRDVVEKALREVNNLSDLTIKAMYVREGRKIAKIKFSIIRDTMVDNDNQIMLPDLKEDIIEFIGTSLDTQDLEYEAGEIGIVEKELDKFLQKYGKNEVKNAISYVKRKIDQKFEIHNKAAYIWTLLSNGLVEEVEQQDKYTKDLFAKEEKMLEDLKAPGVIEFFKELKREFGEKVYKSWMLHLNLVRDERSSVIFSLPTKFICEWMEENYKKQLLKIWQNINPTCKTMELIVLKPDTSSVVDPSGHSQ